MGDNDTMVVQTSVVEYNVSGASGGSVSHAIGDSVSNSAEVVFYSGSMNTADLMSHDSSALNPNDTTNEHFAGVSNPSSDANQVSDYGSLLNVNGVSTSGEGVTATITENGGATSDGMGSAALHQPVDGSGLSNEEERLWSIVTANSSDFNAWTALLDETEKTSEGNILKILKVYDAFLAEFPLCYGYWKKYADHEARLGSVDKVAEVYERAVQGVPYSVDMWLHYCVFYISTYGDPEVIRRLFERAIAYVGTDYLCFPLWDKYIEYEISQQDWPRVATLYTRVLEIPNQQLDRYFEGFKELVASRPLSELRTAEEIAATTVTDAEVAGQEHEGEIPPGAEEQSSKAVNQSLKDAEELEKYIAVREEIYKKAKEFDSRIIGFETAIRRPYFHVRPLNVAELENWHNYLDFIEGVGDFNKVVKLYERCLVACANYPEYWIRYVLSMESSSSMDLAENALARATQVFIKKQPEIHLFAARFKEQHGDIAGARAAYQMVHTGISPGLLEAIIKHANMERRLGNVDDACSLYEQAIAIEKGKEQSQTLPLLFAQFSRFIFLVSGNVERAREILAQGLENAKLSKPLLEALIQLESIQPLPKRIDYIDSLVDKVIVPNPENPSNAGVDEREELSSIFLEFLDLFGDARLIEKADRRHAKLFLHHRSSTESKKRHAEDYLASDRSKLARSHMSAPSVMGAYPATQTQWNAQAWPQSSQPQAQQWNPAYAQQQAAYGAYGSAYTTSYAQSQAPTAVPQSGAYGTYPPTHPAQAYPPPQQLHAQPAAAAAAAAALAPTQPQPTAATGASPPAAYYPGYY